MPLLNTKDPVVVQLKLIAETQLVIPCTFLQANLFEANYGVDEITGSAETKFPVFILVSTGKDKAKTEPGDDIIRKVKILGLLLSDYQAPQGSSEYKSYDVQETIYQMRQLGWNLKYWMNKNPLTVGGDGVSDVEMTDVYQKFDKGLFGVTFECEWEIDAGTSGYLNRAYPAQGQVN